MKEEGIIALFLPAISKMGNSFLLVPTLASFVVSYTGEEVT